MQINAHDPNGNIQIRRKDFKLGQIGSSSLQNNRPVVNVEGSGEKPLDLKKIQAQLGEIEKNFGQELVTKSESNGVVC